MREDFTNDIERARYYTVPRVQDDPNADQHIETAKAWADEHGWTVREKWGYWDVYDQRGIKVSPAGGRDDLWLWIYKTQIETGLGE